MTNKLRFKVKNDTGCCKTVSTVLDVDGKPQLVTIDMSSGRVIYSQADPADESTLRQEINEQTGRTEKAPQNLTSR